MQNFFENGVELKRNAMVLQKMVNFRPKWYDFFKNFWFCYRLWTVVTFSSDIRSECWSARWKALVLKRSFPDLLFSNSFWAQRYTSVSSSSQQSLKPQTLLIQCYRLSLYRYRFTWRTLCRVFERTTRPIFKNSSALDRGDPSMTPHHVRIEFCSFEIIEIVLWKLLNRFIRMNSRISFDRRFWVRFFHPRK